MIFTLIVAFVFFILLILKYLYHTLVWEVEHLSNMGFNSEAPESLINHMHGPCYKSAPLPNTVTFDVESEEKKDLRGMRTHYNKLIGVNECILADIVRRPGSKSVSKAFIRAGPRRKLHFNPATVNAAIVTCGGLCPGLNNVVREITNALVFMYGIKGKLYYLSLFLLSFLHFVKFVF